MRLKNSPKLLHIHSPTSSFLLYHQKRKGSDENKLNTIADAIELVTREMQSNDFHNCMIAIILSLDEERALESDNTFKKKLNDYLPWEDEMYCEKSKFSQFSFKNLPKWLFPNEEGE